MQPGEPLPAIRPLAEELRVNRNTVAKAYAELESQGVIETIAGKGCFVRAQANSPFKKEVRRKLLAEAIDDAVVQAHHLQIGKAEFLRLAEDRFDAFEHKRARAATSIVPMNDSDPVIEITQPGPPLRPDRRRRRPQPARAAGPLLRLLRPQRRRQDDDDQVPAEPAPADERRGSASSASIRRATRSP